MTDIPNLSYEESILELEQIVRKLEDARLPLDQAIKAYERGSLLKEHCAKLLNDVKLRVEKVIVKNNIPEVAPLL